jgi:hypothetical protein
MLHLPGIFPRGLLLAGCIILPAGKAWSLCPDSTVLKRPFFGDLHVHTSYSLDAYARGARNDPWDAYRFAKKDTLVGLTPNQGDTLHPIASQSVEIDRALDFTGVTDHAEYLSIDSTQPCSYLNRDCSRDTLEAWERNIRAAREANDPCRFTSFIAYEYTLGDRGTGPKGMRHRNVIFANDSVPALPAHALDYPTPGSLWARLYATCLNAGTGCDVLAIAHNPNYSKASMFETETEASRPFTAAEAAVRARMEPLVEMIQHKGASECMVGVGNNDEECAFEYDDGRGSGPNPEVVGTHYIREGLKRGLQELNRINVNPFKLGFIGSTDTHNGTPGAVSESRWKGHAGDADATPDSLLSSPAGTNPGGLAVIWAEENTREALFRAMRRRETYATSGPRMIVRMYGGWDWPANVCSAPNRVAIGYRDGVPMGGDMPEKPRLRPGAQPSFVVAAAMDPDTVSRPRTLLQKIEIIKGWVDAAGAVHERVFLVAGQTNNGATVDLSNCNQGGPGETEFCTSWTDTTFQANQPAFYYARVFENPSCHWSRVVANASGLRHPAPLADTIRERAWTSPIWYDPLAGERVGVERPGSGKGASPACEIFATPRKITVKLRGFANPTHLRLLDTKGRFLREIRVEASAVTVTVEKGGLREGSYILQVFHQGKTQTKRFFW